MMRIEPERIQKFIKLYEEEFEETLTEEEAEMMIRQLLDLMWSMAQDLPGEENIPDNLPRES